MSLKMKKLIGAALLVLSVSYGTAADEFDDLFSDPDALVVDEPTTADSTAAAAPAPATTASTAAADNLFIWGGEFSSGVKLSVGYEDLLPSVDELSEYNEALGLDIQAKLWFTARPDRNYRVTGKFSTDYPFDNARIYELFTDFNKDDKLFFRFGKQPAAWGVSRFYQIADPLSVSVKDPTDPVADPEGPLAMRIAYPFGVNALYLYTIVKDSYLPADGSRPSIQDAGVGLKADILIKPPKNPVIGNGELTVGAFYQRNLAPKLVAGYSTGIGKVQVFTDQALSWGLDSARLTDDLETGLIGYPEVYQTEKPDDGLFYSATLGAMYVNNDWHLTAYGEYLFSTAASADSKYLEKMLTRYGLEQDPGSGLAASLAVSDLFGYLSRHNSALSLSWSELFGNEDLSASVLYLQNWVDGSLMVAPSFTVTPFKHFSIEYGLTLVRGSDNSEWVLKNADLSSLVPENRRLTGSIVFRIGGGRF